MELIVHLSSGQALDFVADNFVNKRAGATDVVVLLTDGKSQDDVIKPGNLLHHNIPHSDILL